MLSLAANLAARQRVAEFVRGDNEEQCEVLENIPGDGGVTSAARVDLEHGDKEPGPVHEYIDACDPEKFERPLARHDGIKS